MAWAPPEVPAGKNFTVRQPELERGLDLGGGDGAGQREDAVLLAALDDGAAEAGGDDVGRAGGDGLVDLRDGQDGAGADEDVAAGRHGADRVLGGRRSGR